MTNKNEFSIDSFRVFMLWVMIAIALVAMFLSINLIVNGCSDISDGSKMLNLIFLVPMGFAGFIAMAFRLLLLPVIQFEKGHMIFREMKPIGKAVVSYEDLAEVQLKNTLLEKKLLLKRENGKVTQLNLASLKEKDRLEVERILKNKISMTR